MYFLYNDYIGTDFNKSSGIVNSNDETTNTWNHHYQVSQDSQSLKVANQSQSVEKFQSVSIKNSSTQIKFREQLWTAALEERAMKGLQLIKICKQLWTATSEDE